MRADAAFLQGEYGRARDGYLEALHIHQSVENVREIAVTRINLARTWRELAHPRHAHHQLDALFVSPLTGYPPDLLTAAAALKSQLYLESGEPLLALDWAGKGEAFCQNKCPSAGTLLLLRARLARYAGDLDGALKRAGEAVSVLAAGTQKLEWANAHRLSGEISLEMNDPAQAIRSFQQAYAIDQKLGMPHKIHLDLLRLSTAHERTGETEMARLYSARARAVAAAMQHAHGASGIRENRSPAETEASGAQ